MQSTNFLATTLTAAIVKRMMTAPQGTVGTDSARQSFPETMASGAIMTVIAKLEDATLINTCVLLGARLEVVSAL